MKKSLRRHEREASGFTTGEGMTSLRGRGLRRKLKKKIRK